MAKIFSLFGEIFVENEKANTAIETTATKAKESESKLGGVVSAAGKVGAAVLSGAAVAAGAMTALVGKTVETTGAIQDIADKTGISAEEYQQWAFAAQQSGMSAEQLQGAMLKQQKAFADAKSGNTQLADAYKKLGIDMANVGSSSEAFDLATQKLAGMTDETERNKLASQLFGESYASMTPLLAAGGAGIDALKQQAVDLGAVMSNDTVAAGAQLGDTMDQIKAAAMGIFNSLGTSLIPIVQQFADLIIANLPVLQGMFAQVAPILTQFFAQVMPMLMSLAQQLLPVIFQVLQMLLPVIAQLLPLFITIISALLPPIVDLIRQLLPPLMKLLNVIIPPLTVVIQALAVILGTALGAAIDALLPIIDGMIRGLQGVIDFITGVFTGDWEKAWDGIRNYFGGVFDSLKGLVKAPLNYVIDMINGVFANIGSITIPDWVPGIGGQNFSFPTIPRLAVGLDYVPYDEFPALLHRGERVMTARENAAYSSGTAGIDYDRLAAAIARAMGGVTMAVDGRKFGRLVADYL